jgi:MFS family permease
MVIVNTVVIVQGGLGLDQQATALALAAFGGGSMIAALVLPRLLETVADRVAMLGGGVLLAGGLAAAALAGAGYPAILGLWLLLGLAYSVTQTPSGRLLRRSSHPEDRPALFAAQFALSHACWLLTYPAAGWLGTRIGIPLTFAVLAAVAGAAVLLAAMLWPSRDPETLEHVHADLPADHPHVRGAVPADGGLRHSHAYVIDSHHPDWPRSA